MVIIYLFVMCHLYTVLIYFTRCHCQANQKLLTTGNVLWEKGKIPYVKSDDLPQREKNKQREKWKAASSAYSERKRWQMLF